MLRSSKAVKITGILCSLAVVLTSAAGCAKSSGSTSSTAGKTTNISFLCPLNSATTPNLDNDKVFQKIQQTTNSKLNITFIPAGSYKDKLNVIIASNQLPDVIVADAGEMKATAIQKGVSEGMFWEIGGLLKSYKNLEKLYSNNVVISNASQDGKLYGLPRPRVLGRVGLVIRKDWLDNLGLSMPKTPEDVYNLAKAFTNNDPDKDGKNDTYGLEYADLSSGSYGWNGISSLAVAYGGPNNVGIVNGKATFDFETSQYMQALDLLHKMYSEKLMNQDFALVSGTKRYDAFNKGNVGMMFCTLDDSYTYLDGVIQKTVPTAKLTVAAAFNNKEPSTPGHNGILMFSKTAVKTQAELKTILSFYNRMTQQDMLDLLYYGVEGVNYTTSNGAKVPIKNAPSDSRNDIGNVLLQPAMTTNDQTDTALTKEVYTLYKANEKYLVQDISNGIDSPTYDSQSGTLNQIMFDARVKYVAGNMTQAGFTDALNTWRQRGGTTADTEYTKAYNKLHGSSSSK